MLDAELDCRGLACPEPVIRCRNLVDCESPSRVTILVDNAAASENVGRQLGKNGYAVTIAQEEEDLWRVCGQMPCQDEGAPASQHLDARACATVNQHAEKTLVLIASETLGHGSDELGARLMENFLATLPEMGETLWRVILLNGGVRLSALPGKALDSLKVLEASGISVLVCGACLTHYKLLEARAVGETTNMLDVVTSLALADKVIRP